jgi:hypothetical protein
MVKERIIVLAKTYPELSRKHGALVCVAGVNEYGEWRRLYPIPYALWVSDKYKSVRFSKWNIIEVEVSDRPPQHDSRSEGRRVLSLESIRVVGSIESWSQRVTIINQLLDSNIESVVESGRSLGIVKPYRVLDFYAKPRERLREEAEKDVLKKMDEADATITLLEYMHIDDKRVLPEAKERDVKIEEIPWIGYKFLCSPQCRGHEMMVIDWEAQELFRKYRYVEPVKQRLFYDFLKNHDLYFVVGNTWRFHKSFMIIGLVYPPKGTRPSKPLEPIFKERSAKTLLDYGRKG